MATLFAISKHWKTYDVFNKQKISTFRSSRPAVLELASRYNQLTKQLESKDSSPQSEEERVAAEKVLFTEMCEICLWGNATDLSLLTNLTYEDIQKLQGSKARKAAEKNIIANDFEAAFEILKEAQKSGTKERRVDIVLDNAGFELFVDVILAGYLLQAGLATTVVLRPKDIPWFVSDVVPKDFSDLLTVLVNAKDFYESPSEDDEAKGVTPQKLSEQEANDLQELFSNWSSLYAEGKIVLRPNRFWTEGGSYWRLPKTAPELFEDLQESELVIFKGDLNYRKLTGDVSTVVFFVLFSHPILLPPVKGFADVFGSLGCLGPHHPFHPGHRSPRPWIRYAHIGASHLQGRRRCRSQARRRRAPARDGRRRRRQRCSQVGLERQVGRRAALRWQEIEEGFRHTKEKGGKWVFALDGFFIRGKDRRCRYSYTSGLDVVFRHTPLLKTKEGTGYWLGRECKPSSSQKWGQNSFISKEKRGNQCRTGRNNPTSNIKEHNIRECPRSQSIQGTMI